MKHPKSYDTDEATSRRMSHVKLKRGREEVALAKTLWHKGYRYRLNYKALPGSPDIVITKYRIAIFVDGEFWHGYKWDEKKNRIKRNRDYWVQKIEENIHRDVQVDQMLRSLGWEPIHFWSKDVSKNLMDCIESVEELIYKRKEDSIIPGDCFPDEYL